MRSRVKRSLRPSQLLINLALLTVVLVCLFPVYWTLISSLKGRDEIYESNPSLWIKQPTIENYKWVLTQRHTSMIPLNLLNSFKVAFGSIVIQLFIVTLAGYAFARLDFRGRDAIFYFLILMMFIPRAGGLMATYELMHALHLRNSHLGLMLLFPSPVSVALFIMRQSFLAVPRELEESAMIDGANIWQVFLRIALPMVQSAMIVVAIFEFVYVWGDYLITFTLIDRPELYTISVAIKQVTGWFTLFVSSAFSTYGADNAAFMIAITPVVLVYVIMQRWFVRGLQEGILKL
jgi:ABC-type glycerol-3-phosphate transport system permease component